MSAAEITLAVVLGLIVNEFSDVSPWLARKLVGWSARLRYGDTTRAEIRAEELAAVINDRPGKLFKLGTGVRFASSALATRVRRMVSGQARPSDEPLPDDVLDRARRRPVTLEDEPSGSVARYLFPTEKFRGEWRRHWIHPAKSIAMTVLIAVLAVWATVLRVKPRYAGWMVAAIVVLAVARIALRLANWYLTKFVITNKRLMSTEGVIARRVAMMPLMRVTDLRYAQSVLGRALNYGTFMLESASRRNAMRHIVDLPNPNELYLRLVEEMYEPAAVEARLSSRYEWDEAEADADWALDLPDDRVGEAFDPPEPGAAPARWVPPSPRPRPAPAVAPQPDPDAVRRELVRDIALLAGHLTALTAAIARLAPPREPPLAEPPEQRAPR
jgi:membrane protein YdbS with pleckstrin-like domain